MNLPAPDEHIKAYQRELKRQLQLLTDDPQEGLILDEIEAVADLDGWK